MHEPQLEERRRAPTLLSTNFLSSSKFPNSLPTQLMIHPHSFPLSLLSRLDKKHSNPLRFFILKFKLRSRKQNFFRIGSGGISFLEGFAGSSHGRSSHFSSRLVASLDASNHTSSLLGTARPLLESIASLL
ncbi:hypothetical protein TB1_001284 [Malus domestica]